MDLKTKTFFSVSTRIRVCANDATTYMPLASDWQTVGFCPIVGCSALWAKQHVLLWVMWYLRAIVLYR